MTDTSRNAVERLARGLEASMGGQDDAADTLRALLAAKEAAKGERDENWQKYVDANEARIDAEAEAAALRERMEAIYEICVEPAETDHESVRRWIEVESRNALDQPKEGDSDDG